MIRAFVFDLDGTLVETEKLKAISYARAAAELRPELGEEEVVKAFEYYVGLSRQEVAVGLMQRFGIEEAARSRMAEFGVDTPWQAYVQTMLRIYENMLGDPELVTVHRYPHNIALLHDVRRKGYPTALATQSHREQAKPDLEMHLLAALAAGAEVVAVTTEITRQKFRETELLDRSHIVDDPRTLPEVVRRLTGTCAQPPSDDQGSRDRER